MRVRLESVCEAARQSPVGSASMIISVLCGCFYLAAFFIPLLLRRSTLLDVSGEAATFGTMVMIVGSGLAVLLALFSFGMERRIRVAVASLCILAVAENVNFLVMPFWTAMLLGGWSAWAVLAYAASLVAALGLILRRAVTGKVVLNSSPQFSRCPLWATLQGPINPH